MYELKIRICITYLSLTRDSILNRIIIRIKLEVSNVEFCNELEKGKVTFFLYLYMF